MTKVAGNSKPGSRPGERRGGRRKGTPNKVTADVRAAIAKLAEDLGPSLKGWIERVAVDDPGRAAEIFLRAIEYHVPKLARTDVTSGGEPLPTNMRIELIAVKPQGETVSPVKRRLLDRG
jgi:hypothetical protein